MAEIVLRGDIGLYPREEGGRQLVVQDIGGDFYRLPLTPEQHALLTKLMNQSNEELATELNRQAAAARLAVVQPGNGGPPGQP